MATKPPFSEDVLSLNASGTNGYPVGIAITLAIKVAGPETNCFPVRITSRFNLSVHNKQSCTQVTQPFQLLEYGWLVIHSIYVASWNKCPNLVPRVYVQPGFVVLGTTSLMM